MKKSSFLLLVILGLQGHRVFASTGGGGNDGGNGGGKPPFQLVIPRTQKLAAIAVLLGIVPTKKTSAKKVEYRPADHLSRNVLVRAR